MTHVVKVLKDWEAEMATAGTLSTLSPIGSGKDSTFAFMPGTVFRAISSERAKHRRGRRQKVAA